MGCLGFVEEGKSAWECLGTSVTRLEKDLYLYKAKTNHFTDFGLLFSYQSFGRCTQYTYTWITLSLLGLLLVVMIMIIILFYSNHKFRAFVKGSFGKTITEVEQKVARMTHI